MEYYWKESIGGSGSALFACRYLRAIADHPVLDDEPEEQKILLALAELVSEESTALSSGNYRFF